jgi:hypothetical protein
MQELNGLELASFTSRAVAFAIDFAIAGALFLGGLVGFFKIANRYTSLGANNRHINVELNFFENWYSIVYLVLFFGLSFYFGNGRTIGKRVMGIRVVSIVHRRLGLWHSITSFTPTGGRFTTAWLKRLSSAKDGVSARGWASGVGWCGLSDKFPARSVRQLCAHPRDAPGHESQAVVHAQTR